MKHSVKDRLPDTTWRDVLVWSSSTGYSIATCSQAGIWTDQYGDRVEDVLYWWYLADDPREVEE